MQETSPISSNFNNDPLLIPLNNEIDLFVSQGLIEKKWLYNMSIWQFYTSEL